MVKQQNWIFTILQNLGVFYESIFEALSLNDTGQMWMISRCIWAVIDAYHFHILSTLNSLVFKLFLQMEMSKIEVYR